MPKVIMNYKNTIMYKIVSNDLTITDIYIGHTTNFIQRKRAHKCCCTNPNNKSYNYNVYSFIRDHGNWNNWSMIEIEKYPCKDRQEASKRERYYYEKLNATLNMAVPNQTQEEYQKFYRENNKNEILLKEKEYRKNNREKINESFICNCGGNYTYKNKAQHLKSQKHLKFIKDNKL